MLWITPKIFPIFVEVSKSFSSSRCGIFKDIFVEKRVSIPAPSFWPLLLTEGGIIKIKIKLTNMNEKEFKNGWLQPETKKLQIQIQTQILLLCTLLLSMI